MNNNTKENDWFLNRITNPSFSITNFRDVGLDATNTSLADEKTYKGIPQIQENPMFQTEGKFDEVKFHNTYQLVAESFNRLADETYQEDIIKQASFHRDNVFADPEQKRKGPDIALFKEANPLRQKRGVRRLNLLDNPTQSIDEIAQTQKVWDGATKTWHDSPNDSFWTDFLDTRVMAQWDFDADKDGNPTKDKSKIAFRKGEYKLNDNGTYYYENLNGRNVYGRRVLSKLNTLTTDGSFMNKYDFFDSDDLEKSLGGTFMKNVATIAPMFIPYVGPWYIGAGIATEVAKVSAVLGKIFTGSDNKFLSAVEGFTQSLEPTSSQYAQDHSWAMENILNLTGDVFKQLYEQRWLFKYAPALFKGSDGVSQASRDTKLAKWAKEYRDADLEKLKLLAANKPEEAARALKELQAISTIKAQSRLEEYMKGYNKIGELMSKAYMTSITVQDAYGEAKQQGATDNEAALLTLGYALGEYAIINSKLGEWILPELRMDKERWKQVAKTLTESAQKPLNNAPKEQKAQFMKKLFNMGKDIAQANYSAGKTGLKAVAANALGEGVEEVSEELLYDFAKSVSNLGSWMNGSDTRLAAWDDMTNRYGLSFVGGAIGGGLFQIPSDIREARKLKDLKQNDAYQQLVYMSRNGQMNDFLKQANKMTLGNKYLSATKKMVSDNGEIVWEQGTKDDNQDLAAKNMLTSQAQMIDNILKANGANLTDDSFLDIQTLKDLRFSALTNSAVTGRYLQDYNTVCVEIVDYVNQLNTLNDTTTKMQNGVTDQNERTNGEDISITNERSRLDGLLKEALEKKDSYLNGDRAPEYIEEALFEMSPAINDVFFAATFIRYAEAKTNRSISEIPAAELESIRSEYKKYAETNRKDVVHQAFMIFKTMNEQTSPMFADHSTLFYGELSSEMGETITALQKFTNAGLQNLLSIKDSEVFSNEVTSVNASKVFDSFTSIVSTVGDTQDVSKWAAALNTPVTESFTGYDKYNKLTGLVSEITGDKIGYVVDNIESQGFINPELRNSLLQILDAAENEFYIAEMNSPRGSATYQMLQSDMRTYKKTLNELPNSPITQVLDKFSLSITDSGVRVTKLLADLQNQLDNKLEDISTFDVNNDILSQIKEAIKITQAAKSIISAARVDNISIDNLYGYNTTVNELKPDVPVAEITSNEADSMIQDIETIERKLRFFERLNAVNNEQKLNEQSRTATNKDYIIYKKLVKFVDVIPDSWANKQQFKAALEELTTIKELSSINKLSPSKEEKLIIEKERLAYEDAIYDFFKANSGKDAEALATIINSKNFRIYSTNEEILDATSTDIDDNSFIWYLAARSAVKSTDFYNAYKNIISDTIAPIPTQELAVYLGYASIANGSVIDTFVDAVNQSIRQDWKTMSEVEKREASRKSGVLNWEFPLDSAIAPRFSRVTFVEGIPGSGKTTGVYQTIVTMLKKYHPETLRSVWTGHATKDSAVKLSESLKLDATKTIATDKEGIMKMVSSEWFEHLDKDNNVQIKDNTFMLDENRVLRSTFKINEVSSPPSLILIDEVSRYTSFDLDLIDRFSKKYGVPVIVAGDFDQSRAVGEHKLSWEGKEVVNKVQLYRSNFVRTPKLGVSMRTNNSQKSFNLKLLRSLLFKLKNNGQDGLLLHYYQDETGLYGDKVYNSMNYSAELVQGDIDLMLKTLGSDQKIGYIYSSVSTPLYKLLNTATYKDKINFHEGTSAQGLEGEYYIIEPNTTAQPEQYWSDLYTGITRAMKGSIIVQTEDSITATSPYDSVLDTSTNKEELSSDQVKKFSSDRKQLLDTAVVEGNPIQIIPRNRDNSIPTAPPETNPIPAVEVTTLDDKGDPEEIDIINNGLEREDDYRGKVTTASEDTKPPIAPTVELSVSNGVSTLNTMWYTFNTFETGWATSEDGSPIVDTNSQRIDSFNGLSKVLGTQDYDELMTTLGYLRSTIFNTKDKGELIGKIKSILNLDSDVYATFAYKSTAGVTKNSKFSKFNKDKDSEKLEHIYSKDTKSDSVEKQTLVLIIGQTVNGKSSDILELPLAVMASPLTVMQSKGFEGIKSIYNAIEIADPSMTIYPKMKELVTRLRNSSVTGANEFADYITAWTYTYNGIFFIDDPNWTLAGNLKSQGPSMINKTLGSSYEVDGFVYDGAWVDLNTLASNPGRVVSNVMISPKGIYTDNNSKSIQIAHPGQPFVLISDDITLRGEAIKNYYYTQVSDPSVEVKVKLVYVVPPKATVLQYFDNLKAIITKEGTPTNIGNDLTSFRILNIIMRQPSFETSELNYIKDAHNEILGIVNEIAKLHSVEEQIAVLNRKVDIKSMNANITAKQALQNYLLRAVYPDTFGGGVVFKPNNLQSIQYMLKNNGIEGIFYNIRYDRRSKDTTSMVDAVTTGKYDIDGIPFTVNGKVDSPSFFGDTSNIVTNIISKVKRNGAIVTSTDNNTYLSGNSNLGTTPVANKLPIIADPSVFSAIESSSFKDSSIEEVVSYIEYVLVRPTININGTYYVGDVFKGFYTVKSNVIGQIDQNHYIIEIIGSDKKENLTKFQGVFDLQTREAIVSEVVEPSTAPIESANLLLQTDEELITFMQALKPLKVGHAKFKSLQSSTSIDEFNLKVNDLPTSKGIVQKVEEGLNSFDPGPHRDALQRLVDLLYAKIEMKNSIKQTDESCPILYKIKF